MKYDKSAINILKTIFSSEDMIVTLIVAPLVGIGALSLTFAILVAVLL